MATTTLTGRLIRANRALGALLRRPADGLVGVPYGKLTDDGRRRGRRARGDQAASRVDVVQFEHGLAGESGERRVSATLAPVRDSNGRALYLFLQVQDVSAERAAAEELRRSEERFRLLVEAVEDYAIFMLDPSGHVASWNSGAQRSKGYAADEIIGQHFRVFYPPEVQAQKHPEHELEMALQRRPLRGGGLARPQGRVPVLGHRPDHRRVQRRQASTSGSPRSRVTAPSDGGWSRSGSTRCRQSRRPTASWSRSTSSSGRRRTTRRSSWP